jgi:hypothetical protein
MSNENGRSLEGWNLGLDAWKALEKEIESHSGGSFKLARAFAASVPEVSGIYIICLKPRPGGASFLSSLYNAVYVGQATNLRSRFKDHIDGKTSVAPVLRAFINLEYWYLRCAAEELNMLEKHIYDVIGPKANKVSPPFKAKVGQPTSVNP